MNFIDEKPKIRFRIVSGDNLPKDLGRVVRSKQEIAERFFQWLHDAPGEKHVWVGHGVGKGLYCVFTKSSFREDIVSTDKPMESFFLLVSSCILMAMGIAKDSDGSSRSSEHRYFIEPI